MNPYVRQNRLYALIAVLALLSVFAMCASTNTVQDLYNEARNRIERESTPAAEEQQEAVENTQPGLGQSVYQETPVPAATPPATMQATPVPATVQAEQPATVQEQWVEVDFEPSGDILQSFNIDHDGDERVTIAWFHAGPTDNEQACTIYVVTNPDGGRLWTKGAYRSWRWVGEANPTQQDVIALVLGWKDVLEAEPRGMCAFHGAYTVTWQSETPSTPVPPTTTPLPTVPPVPPTATPVPIAPPVLPTVQVEWVETTFVTVFPYSWEKEAEDYSVCWASDQVTVYGGNAILTGHDACRIGHLTPPGTAEANGQYWSNILQREYGGSWTVQVK